MRTATRHRSSIIAITTSMVIGIVLAFAGPANAQSADGDLTDDDQIVLNGRLLVPDGETVGAAVIFNGPARIDGTVEDSLVVFNGDVVVTGTVDGDVVVFNGDTRIASSAVVGGNLVSRTTPDVEPGATVRGDQQQITGQVDWGEVGLASRIAWWIGYSVSALILGLVLLLLAPGLDTAVTRAVRERLGGSFGFGALLFFGIPIVAALLLVTIVGIPLGVFLFLGLALLYTVAYVAGAHAVGRLVVKAPSSRFLAFLAGLAILRALALVPVLGGLTWLVATILGFGVLFVAMQVGRSRPAVASAGLPPAPSAPVAPEPRG